MTPREEYEAKRLELAKETQALARNGWTGPDWNRVRDDFAASVVRLTLEKADDRMDERLTVWRKDSKDTRQEAEVMFDALRALTPDDVLNPPQGGTDG